MPNHIHLIIELGEYNYHNGIANVDDDNVIDNDHVIRDEQSYLRIKSYIRNNPANWDEDKFNASWKFATFAFVLVARIYPPHQFVA